MSTYTPITLNGNVQSFTNRDLYGEIDGTGLQGQYKTFDITLSINSQSHGDGSTRESNLYNGIDIEVGMWISDDSGNTILKIVSIESKTETTITLTAEDVDMLSYRLKNNNTFSNGGNIVIFKTNVEGEAILATSSGFLSGAIDSIQSRFQLNERDDRIKFEHLTAPLINTGDIVTIDGDGSLIGVGDISAASSVKVGTVVEKLKSGKDVYVKPFNDIITRYKNPEILTGNPGTTYYSDPLNPGDLTTVANGNAVFLQLNNSIPTEILATNSNLPTGSDIVKINGITAYDGTAFPAPAIASLTDWVDAINIISAQTNVDASSFTEPGVVSSDNNTLAYAGSWGLNDVFIPISQAGQTPSGYAEITISDGNNSANIVFDTPDETILIGSPYDIMSPTAIKAEFDAAILANGLEITTSLISLASGNGQGIKLETTGAATGITIVNVTNDAFGSPAVGSGSSTGLNEIAELGTSVLKLTRTSGGDIEITGSPVSGGYINQGGIVSSNSGRVPYLLMLEGVNDGGLTEVGVETDADLNKIPNVTSIGLSDPTGVFITYTPFHDSNVQVLVNGINVTVGNGVKTRECYFSNHPTGDNARLIADITEGDQLFWNGDIIGYELDGGDEIDIIYDASSNDI